MHMGTVFIRRKRDLRRISADTQKISWEANFPIGPGYIPPSVKSITLGHEYNYELKIGDIPYGVTHFDLGNAFNHPLPPGCIPNTVTHLVLGMGFNQEMQVGCIPDSVTNICFRNLSLRVDDRCIPSSVTHCEYRSGRILYQIPRMPNLTDLVLSCCIDQRVDISQVSANLTSLTFNCSFSVGSGTFVIPDGVTYVKLNSDFKIEKYIMPDSITRLNFGSGFDQGQGWKLEKHHIPPNVTHIVWNPRFEIEFAKDVFPDSLTHIKFGSYFGRYYKQKIEEGLLPDSVEHIRFGPHYDQSLCESALPHNLKTIMITPENNMDLSQLPSHVKVYIVSVSSISRIDLTNIRNRVYVESSALDEDIIKGKIENVYYRDTVEEEGTKYLFVNGKDYVPANIKSARK